jgi:hypothetical protein
LKVFSQYYLSPRLIQNLPPNQLSSCLSQRSFLSGYLLFFYHQFQPVFAFNTFLALVQTLEVDRLVLGRKAISQESKEVCFNIPLGRTSPNF